MLAFRTVTRIYRTCPRSNIAIPGSRAYASMATDTSKYKLNHSMLRVKDPQKSIAFYSLLGMTQINTLSFPSNNFTLYFLAYDSPRAMSHSKHWTDREGILELTHNHGSENDANFKTANGNSEPGKGFGHTCISVDNIQAACQKIRDAGYGFQKKLSDGKMRNIAFALDPDGYWVEIIGQKPVEETEGVKETDSQSYRFNHTMIRIKDPSTSLPFYQQTMGMTLLRTVENASSNFNLYFLGYPSPSENITPNKASTAHREGLLELTWNYGTEKDEGFRYHDGNSEPQGFGHICISVDDLDAACSRFEELKVSWKKRLTDGRMKDVAFVLDPDGYWIEVVQNEKLKTRSSG